MKNPLTFRIESILGSIFILALSVFFIAILFIAMKNLNSDIDILDLNSPSIKSLSLNERTAIKEWIEENNIKIPAGKGFRYLIKEYPDKLWYER